MKEIAAHLIKPEIGTGPVRVVGDHTEKLKG
jgi:hypothetical protein